MQFSRIPATIRCPVRRLGACILPGFPGPLFHSLFAWQLPEAGLIDCSTLHRRPALCAACLLLLFAPGAGPSAGPGAGPADGQQGGDAQAAARSAVQPAIRERILEAVGALQKDIQVVSIAPAPLPGLYQVLIGADVLYFTADARYVIRGEIYDLQELRNITGEQIARLRVQRLLALTPEQYIEFPAREKKHTVYVFTDTDCGYCRAMHARINDYNRLGISFRYLAYPRNGLQAAAAGIMRKIWCAEDRQEALSLAKRGHTVYAAACADPVDEQYQLGDEMGITGTPAVFSDTGRYLSGYISPGELLTLLQRLQEEG